MKKSRVLLALVLFSTVWVMAAEVLPSGAAEQEQNASRPWRRIFIIRHGQRPDEVDPRLSVLGAKQAQLVAERLQAVGFDGDIYASPYRRTVETAAAAAVLFEQKIRLCPELQEVTTKPDVPNTPGLTHEQLAAEFPGLIAETPKLAYPWVLADNRGPALEKYVADGIEKILEETTGDVAIFSHGAQTRAAVNFLTENTSTSLKFSIWNCMLCTFLVKPDGTFALIGITADFIPPDEISNNVHKGILGKKIPAVMPQTDPAARREPDLLSQ